LLREILKQDRLTPQSETFQMAWLVAFNEGLFTDISPEQLPALLTALQEQAEHSTLSLDSPREQWRLAVADWLHPAASAAQP
jgi:F-type H+-transporting ATPase subunit alpha